MTGFSLRDRDDERLAACPPVLMLCGLTGASRQRPGRTGLKHEAVG